jgi:hypothetical protein
LQLRESWASPHFSFSRYPFSAPAASAPIGPSGEPGTAGTVGEATGGVAAACPSDDADAVDDDDVDAEVDETSPDLWAHPSRTPRPIRSQGRDERCFISRP